MNRCPVHSCMAVCMCARVSVGGSMLKRCVAACRSACVSISKKACVHACSVTSKGPAAPGFAMCPESFDTSRCIIKTLPHCHHTGQARDQAVAPMCAPRVAFFYLFFCSCSFKTHKYMQDVFLFYIFLFSQWLARRGVEVSRSACDFGRE